MKIDGIEAIQIYEDWNTKEVYYLDGGKKIVLRKIPEEMPAPIVMRWIPEEEMKFEYEENTGK